MRTPSKIEHHREPVGDRPAEVGEPQSLADIRLHPALIVLGALAIEAAGRDLWTSSPDGALAPMIEAFGEGLAILGIVVLVFAYGAMARARTTIDPRRPTSAIVSRGIYRFSRNPIYLGWFVFMVGGGLANLSLFQVLVPVVMILLLHRAVVLKEEKYLEATFGDTYVRYRDGVRRWL